MLLTGRPDAAASAFRSEAELFDTIDLAGGSGVAIDMLGPPVSCPVIGERTADEPDGRPKPVDSRDRLLACDAPRGDHRIRDLAAESLGLGVSGTPERAVRAQHGPVHQVFAIELLVTDAPRSRAGLDSVAQIRLAEPVLPQELVQIGPGPDRHIPL